MLLQNALEGEKVAETNEDGATRRKALTDIGNTLAKPNAQKPPNRRNKWGKSVIQLVPIAPPASQLENAAAPVPQNPPQKPENCPNESEIPLKLPRAMRSASSNGSKLLRERNADQHEDSTNSPCS